MEELIKENNRKLNIIIKELKAIIFLIILPIVIKIILIISTTESINEITKSI